MSEDTHSHVALRHGEGLSGQHVCLHQILHVDPVHACPTIPKPEHEKSLPDVALVQGRGQCRLTGVLYTLSTRSQLPISNGLDSSSTSQVLWTSPPACLTDDLRPPLIFLNFSHASPSKRLQTQLPGLSHLFRIRLLSSPRATPLSHLGDHSSFLTYLALFWHLQNHMGDDEHRNVDTACPTVLLDLAQLLCSFCSY